MQLADMDGGAWNHHHDSCSACTQGYCGVFFPYRMLGASQPTLTSDKPRLATPEGPEYSGIHRNGAGSKAMLSGLTGPRSHRRRQPLRPSPPGD